MIGHKLKELREERGMKQDELAKKLSVSPSAIGMYEINKREPNNELIKKIANFFNVSVDYLMGNSDYKNEIDFFEKNAEASRNLIEFGSSGELDLINFEKLQEIINTLIKIENPEIFETVLKSYINYMPDLLKDKVENFIRTACDYGENFHLKESTSPFDVLNSEKTECNDSKYYMCPVYGQISAGQPNWAEENIEGRIPIDVNLMNIVNPEEHFFLRVNGESMNKVIKNGAFALIHKQDIVDDGEIAVVLVNGYDATLKKFTKQGDFIILEPQSNDESFKSQVYDKNTPIKILGKYVGKMEINK